MSIFKALKASFLRSAEKSGRARAQRELLSMSDRQLRDFGFSRTLLLQGESAWPWRDSDTSPVARVATVNRDQQDKRAQAQAINELHAFSDRELAELGVSRNSIEEVVRFGRPAGEGVVDSEKSAA